MQEPQPYDRKFYDDMIAGAVKSARSVLPIVLQLCSPRSVIDVGCGRGVWLKVFAELGVEDYQGVDGHYVESSSMLIDPSKFLAHDLSTPLSLDRGFDLAVCLEVAEHLLGAKAAGLVEFLTGLSPLVLFSAAVPGQGGTCHVNEQWPIYWQQLFSSRGYRQLDPIRRQIFQSPDVEWWYQQNIFLYASETAIAASPTLQHELARSRSNQIELIGKPVLEEYGRLLDQNMSCYRLARRFASLLKQRLKSLLSAH